MAISTLQAHHRFRIFCGDEASCHISSNDKFDLHQEQYLVDHTIRPYSLSLKAICFRIGLFSFFLKTARQGLTPFIIHPLFLFHRTEGADEKIVEGLPAVIGEVAGSGAGKRI